jgi:hypothetical protein
MHKRGFLRRVHVLADRIQDMHDADHIAAGGKKASQSQKHAWFVFDRSYCGLATIIPISRKQPSAQMPWASSVAEPTSAGTKMASTALTPVSTPKINGDASAAHSPFGGSVAARILGCPASISEIAKVPVGLRKIPGPYAERGTALHAAIIPLIERECTLDDIAG